MMMTLQKLDSLTYIVIHLQARASSGALNQGKWPHNFVIQNFLYSCTLLLGRHSSSGLVL
ncbi:hypothetical protein SLEP1_g56581 [Rubroshorea leprosula]|uniref:Ycf15 n=1 Tax=Rubroshorea leprosula TaxID=152421 RepID=A0AAV5MLG5_9ROSI|nr:hypothetical protein SLEP1_g56581 [Rubroshorea leprosula]